MECKLKNVGYIFEVVNIAYESWLLFPIRLQIHFITLFDVQN